LQSEMKLQWFREEWQDWPSWIKGAETALRHHWATKLELKGAPLLSAGAGQSTPTITVTYDTNIVPNWKSKKRQHQAADSVDQFERFQEWNPDDDIPGGPLQYWVDRLNDPHQSLVAHMGVELMSIPAKSDEPEHLFCSAKLRITDRRNWLGDDIIQASECLKSWVQQGIVFGASESDIVRMEQMLKDLASRSAE
jgi:hypothetical protein